MTAVTLTVTVAVSVPPLPSRDGVGEGVGADEVRRRGVGQTGAAPVMVTVPFGGPG